MAEHQPRLVNPFSRGGRRRVVWILAGLGVMVLAAGGAVALTFEAGASSQTMWARDSGDPIPEHFYAVWFPKSAAQSFADEAMSKDPSPWTRPLLNRHEEMKAPAVSCVGPNGTRRFIAPGDLASVPSPGQLSSIAEMVAALKGTSVPPIRDIEYTIVDAGPPAKVVVFVRDERSTNIYEYKATEAGVTPERWTRRYGLGR